MFVLSFPNHVISRIIMVQSSLFTISQLSSRLCVLVNQDLGLFPMVGNISWKKCFKRVNVSSRIAGS